MQLCEKCKKKATPYEDFKLCIGCRDKTGLCWRCNENPRYDGKRQKYDCCRECLLELDGKCKKCGEPGDPEGVKCYAVDHKD